LILLFSKKFFYAYIIKMGKGFDMNIANFVILVVVLILVVVCCVKPCKEGFLDSLSLKDCERKKEKCWKNNNVLKKNLKEASARLKTAGLAASGYRDAENLEQAENLEEREREETEKCEKLGARVRGPGYGCICEGKGAVSAANPTGAWGVKTTYANYQGTGLFGC
jgi:hypothetical protein